MNITKRIIITLGVLFLLAALLGYAMPGLFGMHLSLTHNLVHLVSGLLAVWFGLKGTASAARTFAIVFGCVYALLGLAGLVTRGPDHLLTVIPNHLILSMTDHVANVILGAVFLIAGLVRTHEPVRGPI